MHNLTVSLGVGIIGEVILTYIYMNKPTLLDGAVVKMFGWLSATARFNNFYMGIFNLADIIYYLSITFIFCSCQPKSLRRRDGAKEVGSSEQ